MSRKTLTSLVRKKKRSSACSKRREHRCAASWGGGREDDLDDSDDDDDDDHDVEIIYSPDNPSGAVACCATGRLPTARCLNQTTVSIDEARTVLRDAKRIVVKIGSALLTDDGKGLARDAMAAW